MNEKILQIIPSPVNMRVHYENRDDTDPHGLYNRDGKPLAISVTPICLALVELECGDREITPITMHSDGSFILATFDSDFVCITTE